MTSTVANSGIDVCSRALILIGADPITSFDDPTTEALVAVNMYEDVAQAALASMRWRFATEQSQLSRLVEAPTGRYDAAYQVPADMLMMNALTINDMNVEHTIYGDKIFCNVSPQDELVADYIYRAPEEDWPSYFTIAVEYTMASVFAGSIARNETLVSIMDQKAAIAMAKARSLDSQQNTTRKLTTSRFLTERLS
jgi:hypothetical protein